MLLNSPNITEEVFSHPDVIKTFGHKPPSKSRTKIHTSFEKTVSEMNRPGYVQVYIDSGWANHYGITDEWFSHFQPITSDTIIAMVTSITKRGNEVTKSLDKWLYDPHTGISDFIRELRRNGSGMDARIGALEPHTRMRYQSIQEESPTPILDQFMALLSWYNERGFATSGGAIKNTPMRSFNEFIDAYWACCKHHNLPIGYLNRAFYKFKEEVEICFGIDILHVPMVQSTKRVEIEYPPPVMVEED